MQVESRPVRMPTPSAVDYRVILSGGLANLAGFVLPLIVGLATMPALIHGLGVERFGVLTLVWTLFGYLGLLDLGLARALTVVTAAELARRDPSALGSLIGTGLVAMGAFGAVGGALLLAIGAPLLTRLASDALRPEVQAILPVLAALVPVTTTTGGFRGLLEAQLRYATANAISAFAGVLMFILPLVALAWWGPDLRGTIGAVALGRVLALLLFAAACVPILRSVTFGLSVATLKRLLGLGGWVTLTNAASPALIYSDRFVIGGLLSASAVAYYATPHEVAFRLMTVPQAVGRTFLTIYQRLDGPAARATYDFAFRLGLVTVVVPATACATLAAPALRLWIGEDFAAASAPVLQVLSLALLFNAAGQAPFLLIQAFARPDLSAKLHAVEAAVTIPAFAAAAAWAGLPGVAWVAALRGVADALAMMLLADGLLPAPRNRRLMAQLAVSGALPALAALTPMPTAFEFPFAAALLATAAAWSWLGLTTPAERTGLRNRLLGS